jgi:hypothetical protein
MEWVAEYNITFKVESNNAAILNTGLGECLCLQRIIVFMFQRMQKDLCINYVRLFVFVSD